MSESSGAGAGDRVRFFNVSLVNANVMSIPKFPQPQRLVGELIHSIQAAGPSFAWVQFLFKRADYSRSLVALKNAMHYAQEEIKTPKRSWIDDSEYDRAELHRDWYKRSGERIKRIDAVTHSPHVLLAIQGMWVGDPNQLSSLPFKDCYDEHDRLGAFVYRNPRMLLELVERRMVDDISSYIVSYARSRLEPPSLLITQEEVPYYLHFPVSNVPDFMKSMGDTTAFSAEVPLGSSEASEKERGKAAGGETRTSEGPSVSRLLKVPEIKEPLDEEASERLALLPSQMVRGFEVVFQAGATQLLLSSRNRRDMVDYLSVMGSVYGELELTESTPKPGFLASLPSIVGLGGPKPPAR